MTMPQNLHGTSHLGIKEEIVEDFELVSILQPENISPISAIKQEIVEPDEYLGEQNNDIEPVEKVEFNEDCYEVEEKYNYGGDAEIVDVQTKSAGRAKKTRKKRGRKKGRTLRNCSQCDYSTVFGRDLGRHAEKHLPADQKSFKCPEENCFYSSTYKACLISHLATKHDVAKYQKACAHCGFVTGDKRVLAKHIFTRHFGNPFYIMKKNFPCARTGCNFSGYCQRNLNAHAYRDHGDDSGINKCPYCYFVTPYSLKSHIECRHEKTDTTRLKCTYCSVNFETKSALVDHVVRKHCNSKTLKICDYCGFATPYRRTLVYHINRHFQPQKPPASNKKCVDPGCDFTSNVWQELTKHFWQKHGEKMKKCSVCYFSTTSKTNFKMHMASHEKSFKCEIADCDYKANNKYSLDNHLQKHTFECTSMNCTFTTYRKTRLEDHVENEHKKYKCRFACGFPASGRNVIRKHVEDNHAYHCQFPTCAFSADEMYKIDSHIAETHMFCCKYENCKFSVEQKFMLRAHYAANHTFNCQFKYCTFSTHEQRLLDDHMASKHKKGTFKCGECCMVFSMVTKGEGSFQCPYCYGRGFGTPKPLRSKPVATTSVLDYIFS